MQNRKHEMANYVNEQRTKSCAKHSGKKARKKNQIVCCSSFNVQQSLLDKLLQLNFFAH